MSATAGIAVMNSGCNEPKKTNVAQPVDGSHDHESGHDKDGADHHKDGDGKGYDKDGDGHKNDGDSASHDDRKGSHEGDKDGSTHNDKK